MKVVAVENLETTSNHNKPYSGEGNFQGHVTVELIYEDGTVEARGIDGEHGEDDIKVNYLNPEHWNV